MLDARIAQEHPGEHPHRERGLPGRIQFFPARDDAGQRFCRMGAEFIEHRSLMNARDRAKRRASFGLAALSKRILARITLQRNARTPSLLRAVMHQPIFADIEKSSAGRTMPSIRSTAHDVALKGIKMCKGKQAAAQPQNSFIDVRMRRTERLKLPAAVMQNPHCALKS